MKFLIAFAAVAAVAVAVPVQHALMSPDLGSPTLVVDESGMPIAIGPASLDFSPIFIGPALVDQHPISVGPAIVEASPIAVGPAIVDGSPIAVGPAIVEGSPIAVGPAIVEGSPIAVGPALIDFPVPNPSPVVSPSPVIIGETPAGSTPLVQIIVNVNAPQSAAIVPTPADNAAINEEYVPGPVNIVDHVIAPESALEPEQVVAPIFPGPVNIVDNVVAEPIVVSPVIVGTPIIPSPVVIIPDELN